LFNTQFFLSSTGKAGFTKENFSDIIVEQVGCWTANSIKAL